MMTALSGLINLMGLISGASSQHLANSNVRKLKCHHAICFALPPLHIYCMHPVTSALVVLEETADVVLLQRFNLPFQCVGVPLL